MASTVTSHAPGANERRRVWLTLATGGALTTSLVLAQTSSPVDPTSFFAQLGIASIVCVLLLAWGLTQQRRSDLLGRENNALRDAHAKEIAELRDAMLARERELSNGTIPLLAQAVALLKDTPTAIKETLSEASRTAASQSATNATVSRLEAMVERLSEDHDR